MARYGSIALLALVVGSQFQGVTQAGGKEQQDLAVQGKLTRDDPKDKRRNGASQVHVLKMKAGRLYTIDMVAKDFDSYLFLEDNRGTELAADDDSGGNLNARIIFNCTKDGEYRIVATAFSAEGVGNYALTVKSVISTQKSSTSHDALVGKPAVDFAADFVLNAQLAKLSEFKGKVVLLHLWEVRSANCLATLAQVRDWHKAHKENGMEIVGISFYQFEIGQYFGFDKESGALKKVDQADKKAEQAMLRDFAEHHKLEHALVTLAKDNALSTFNAYAVNGVPQFVLIDRKGVIRLIRVGEDEKTLAVVEEEIKKLVAQK